MWPHHEPGALAVYVAWLNAPQSSIPSGSARRFMFPPLCSRDPRRGLLSGLGEVRSAKPAPPSRRPRHAATTQCLRAMCGLL